MCMSIPSVKHRYTLQCPTVYHNKHNKLRFLDNVSSQYNLEACLSYKGAR